MNKKKDFGVFKYCRFSSRILNGQDFFWDEDWFRLFDGF